MKCYSGIFWGQVTGQVFNKTTVLVLLFVFLFLPHRLGHLYCDYSTPCRGGRGTMSVEKLQSPTNSCNGVVLALSEDHHSLPLVIFFRKVLGLLRNFCDVIGLF